jgi:hypothetical protein
MTTGYTRADIANNIADNNIINASDLDAEFDALQTAFNATNGHSHDGTLGEGAPILVVGPTQDVVITASTIQPKTDNTVDLGTSTLEFKDLWIDGTANIDSLVADTADINGGTVDGAVIGGATPAAGTFTDLIATNTGVVNGRTIATISGTQTLTNKTISVDDNTVSGIAASSFVLSNASGNIDGTAAQKAIPSGVVVGTTDTQTLTNKTINLGSNTLVATSAQLAAALTDETGTGSVVFSASPALTGTPTAPTAANGTNTTQIATTAFVQAALTGSGLGDMLRAVYDTNSDGVVDSADKWQTARTITIGSTGKSVDGTSNVSWNLTEIGVNNSTLTLATSGIATGSQTWTSNQGTNATFTVDVPGTNLSVTGGTTAGPTLNSSTGTGVVIPSASGSASGIVTTGAQTFGGTKTFSTINLTDLTATNAAITNLTFGGTAITATATEINYLSGVTSAIQTQIDGKQPLDSDLTALAGLGTTGIIVRSGSGTAVTRAIAAGTGLTVADGTGVSGNPTLSADIASQVEAEAGTSSTKLMTPQRTAQAIDAQATQKLSFSSLTSVGTGSNVDVTGIPAGVTEIEVYLVGVSENAASNLLIQFIVGGSPVTSGYVSASGNSGAEVGSTSGFVIYQGTASRTANGTYRLVLVSSGTWVGTHAVGMGVATAASSGGGSATGVGTVEGIRLSTPGNFDAGSIAVSWR